MRFTVILSLLFYSLSGYSQPEWQFYVPAETVEVSGVVVMPNQAFVVNHVNGIVGRGVNGLDQISFELPDSAVVSGLSANHGILDRLTISFATPVDEYLPGDVIYCNDIGCTTIFSVIDDLGLSQPVYVDAINWDLAAGAEKLQLSFSQDFEFDQDTYHHSQVYELDFIGVGDIQLNPIPVVVANDFNITENVGLNAFDNSDLEGVLSTYLSVDSVFSRETDEVIFPAKIFEISGNEIINFQYAALTAELKNLSAVMMIDTGWAQWQDQGVDIQVSESAGTIDLDVLRQDGNEMYIEFLVIPINGSGVQGVDFELNSGTTVEWFHTEDANQTFNLDVLDNADLDGNRSFELRLIPQSRYALTAPNLTNRITITIMDDDGDDLIFKNGFE